MNNEICVPSGAVSAYGGATDNDGADNAVAPEVGDEVEVTVKGKVSRVEGDNVYFTPTEANGQPIPEGSMDSGGGDDEEGEMDRMVAGAAEKGGYL